ncbi:8923_t:CDS:2 [Entrophospora sp. SA101]|nr:8923_t:CDS:2 [Entrophospora sp. SA101]
MSIFTINGVKILFYIKSNVPDSMDIRRFIENNGGNIVDKLENAHWILSDLSILQTVQNQTEMDKLIVQNNQRNNERRQNQQRTKTQSRQKDQQRQDQPKTRGSQKQQQRSQAQDLDDPEFLVADDNQQSKAQGHHQKNQQRQDQSKIQKQQQKSQDQDHQQPKTPDHQDNQQSEAQCHHQKDQQRQDQSKTQRNRKQQQKSRVQYQQPKAPDHQNNQHQQPKTQDHHQKDKQRQEKSTTQNNLREQQPKNQRSNKTIIKSNNSYNGKRTANVINNNLDRSSMSQSTNKSAKIYEIPDPSLLPQQQRSLPYPTIETFYSKKRKYKKLEISSDEEYNNVEEKILSASNSSLLSVSQGSPPLHPSMQQMLPLAPSSPFTISSPESSSSCLSQLSSEDFDYIISQQRSSISISFQSSSSSQVVKDHNGNDILVVNSQVEKRPLSQNESDINTKYVQKKKKISQKTVEF